MDAYETINDTLVSLFKDILKLEEEAIITGEFSDITNNDMHIIEAIGLTGKSTMSAVAKKLGITAGSLTSAVNSLVNKKYVVKEHPKKKVGNVRVQDESLPIGYNIVAGKMSFEVSKILDPNGIAPTLVAMDMQHLYVVDGNGLRTLSLREGLRLFGYPDDYKFDVKIEDGYDLLGNTVVVPVIKAVSERVVELYQKHNKEI